MANLKDLETTAEEVLQKLKSNQLFQSKWDTTYFIIFLIVLGVLLLLLLLICFNCCCSPCRFCCRCCRCCYHCCHRCSRCCSRCCPRCCPPHSSRSQTMSAKQVSPLALEGQELHWDGGEAAGAPLDGGLAGN
ncbi:hypothetical protein QTO34_013488 [Cnephaeus nilssonii]|uniref:Small integral membrane protein 22 n=1 Tax=Cnephaeus nilssonii TaxID=3371016 RepID=A0AA40I964_CNENI|nr:hypothetical protein QTO34_013488 [Eptesicus nilssonii]